MTSMYFSGKSSNDIFYDDPDNRCIQIYISDRVLISGHQSFSGFFKYDIKNGQTVIGYYIINDPKTTAHAITLRFAIAGFFYQTETDALKTKETKDLIIAHNTYRSDPFDSVLPRHLGSGNIHTQNWRQ